ncbi:hypothetical protein EII34_01855 [Arachnia propionica]|uniref:Uncharacterized protein n=1 Tax=Arachnia propionica TaxID=1750 RepID=A0A3P1TCS5_9ACTN|nr:hypothetical protein [Arachnia propionica]RRD07252.1 hypothetical protein EII34_01855 [Arachnia propionica]
MTPPPRVLLIIVTVCCGLTAALVFLLALPEVTAACGAPPLDTRPFWSREEALELARTCGQEGRAAYRRLALLDLLHPVLVAATLVLWVRWSRSPHRRPSLVVQAVILLGAGADLMENWAVWTLLAGGPGLDGSALLRVGGGISLAKNVLVSFGMLGAAAVILDAVRHRVLTRRHTDEHDKA